MKATGIVRKLDQLGRIVLPKELRDEFEIHRDTPVEIFTEGRDIILRKYQPGCVFCGSVKDVIRYKDQNVCEMCVKALSDIK